MIEGLAKALRFFLVLLMTALVFSVTWQVLSRYALDQPSSWTEEAARFLLVWIGVLGAAYVSHAREHLAIDLLPRRLSGTQAKVLCLFIELAVLAFALLAMVVGGTRLVMITWELDQVMPALGIPTAFLYLVVPLSGLMITLFGCVHVLQVISQLVQNDEEQSFGRGC